MDKIQNDKEYVEWYAYIGGVVDPLGECERLTEYEERTGRKRGQIFDDHLEPYRAERAKLCEEGSS